MPIRDGRADGVDLSKSLRDMDLPVYREEPTKGSIGAVFYTVTEQTRSTKPDLSLNIQCFVLLGSLGDDAGVTKDKD